MKLLNIDSNAKTVKGQKKGYMTAIMYLAPYKLSGYNVCPKASPGCIAACLNTAGRGAMNSVQKARVAKTKFFFENRTQFMSQLWAEIANFKHYATKKGLIPCVRLNGTSDIVWEKIKMFKDKNVFELFPDIQFYDYTKRTNRTDLPPNYHLTFSLAENNDKDAGKMLDLGINVAAVFLDSLPEVYMGVDVINGDETDLRFLDPNGVVVGLKAKGKAKKDRSGFVR